MFVDSKEVVGELKQLIKQIYRSVTPNVSRAVAQAAVARFQGELVRTQQASTPEQSNVDLGQQLPAAFTQLKYHGSAYKLLHEHLERCWVAYSGARGTFTAPCTAILQSSGSGKSRSLEQMAGEMCKRDSESMRARVLYMCMREKSSTGFPLSTDALASWLFARGQTEREISEKLVVIYEYARQNWEEVGDEWLQLFTSLKADRAVASASEAASERDAQLEQKMTHKSASDAKQGSTKPQVVILAVDEARMLLSLQHMKVDYYRLLRRALVMANEAIGLDGGILAVLVDTSSNVSDLLPPLASDSSSRNHEPNPLTLLPALVLSHTMDSYWRHQLREEGIDVGEDDDIPIHAYQSIVTEKDEAKVWRALVGMGRPLWASTFLAAGGELDGVTERAAAVEPGNAKDPQHAVDTVLSLAAQQVDARNGPDHLDLH